MSFSGIVNSPAALDLLTQVQLRFYDAFGNLYASDPAYRDFEKFVFMDSPSGDLVYTIYSQPGVGMREWLDARPMTQIDFKYFTQAVRKFADGMKIDLDDVKPDSGNAAKLYMYQDAVMRLGEAAALLWPGLIAEVITKGLTSIWLPDGQFIWDSHPFNPDNAGLGSFRNYYSKTVQGGGVATPITYGNLLGKVQAGYGFKLPNGKDKAIRYTHLVVPPSLFPVARRLTMFDRLPVMEIENQTISTSGAGGEAQNEIKTYGIEPLMLANMPALNWMLVDASSPSARGIGLKKRQEITWQYLGPGAGAGAVGMEDNDSGAVSEMAFEENQTKWGPKARGEGFFRNWWSQVLCDGTP